MDSVDGLPRPRLPATEQPDDFGKIIYNRSSFTIEAAFNRHSLTWSVVR